MHGLLLALIAGVSIATPALAQLGLAPGVGAGKVLSAQFAIQGPTTTVCPNQARATGWVYTNYLGNVTIMIARRGQAVGAPITIKAVPAANGQYMATYTQTIPITAPIDAEYRLLVGGGSGITSNWVRLRASCSTGAGPGNLFGG
jgi:hypothetical protein